MVVDVLLLLSDSQKIDKTLDKSGVRGTISNANKYEHMNPPDFVLEPTLQHLGIKHEIVRPDSRVARVGVRWKSSIANKHKHTKPN